MIIKCPITKKTYERIDYSKYHEDDCPYCKGLKKNKSKIFIVLISALFLISLICLNFVSASNCFQETANASTGTDGNCGLNYTGSYLAINDSTVGYFYINYSKPITSTNATWEVKFGQFPTTNISVPNSCFSNSNILQFRFISLVKSDYSLSTSYGQCFNGTWSNITNIALSSLGTGSYNIGDNRPSLYDGDWSTNAYFDQIPASGSYWLSGNNGGLMNATIYEEAVIWNATLTPDTNPPTVTLNSPNDLNITNLTSVTFNCSAIDDVKLANISLYTNITNSFILNQTSILTGTSNSSTFTISNLLNGTYNWNCYSCDNSSNCAFASSNRTFTVNTSYGSSPTCTPNWNCSDWSTCSGGSQSRTCNDLNSCGNTSNEPSLTQACNTGLVELDVGTILNSTGLNTTINITQTTYCTSVSVDSNDINLVGCSLDAGLNTITINITNQNKRYNSTSIPYFTSTDVNSKTISSTFSVNGTFNLAVSSCSSVGSITLTSGTGVVTNYKNSLFQTSYTCSNNVVTLNAQLDSGINTFSINNGSTGELTACNATLTSFLGYVALLGLVGTVFFLSLALLWVFNIGNKSTISSVLTIGSVVSIIMVGILIIVAIFIFSSLCMIV